MLSGADPMLPSLAPLVVNPAFPSYFSTLPRQRPNQGLSILWKWLKCQMIIIRYQYSRGWTGKRMDSKETGKAKKCYICKHWSSWTNWWRLSTGTFDL